MKHSTCTPDKDRPQIALLCAHPINKFSSEKHADSIENGKDGSNGTILIITPSKLFLNTSITRIGQ